MTLIKISEDGLIGYEINQKISWAEEIILRSETSYPLTELGEPNCEVEAELVWQKSQKHTKIWHNVEQQDYITYNNFRNFAGWVDEKGYETRQAWQISKPKVETPEVKDCFGKKKGCEFPDCDCVISDEVAEVTEQSIEECKHQNSDISTNGQYRKCHDCKQLQVLDIGKWRNLPRNEYALPETGMPCLENTVENIAFIKSIAHYNKVVRDSNDYVEGFVDGANHILTSKGMVELDKVVEMLENVKYSGTPYHLMTFQDAITELLTKIKDLKL